MLGVGVHVGCVGARGYAAWVCRRTSLPAACRPQPRRAPGLARAYLAAGRAAGARGEPSASRARPSRPSRQRASPPQRVWRPPPPPPRPRPRPRHRHRERVLLAGPRPPARRRQLQRCVERGRCHRGLRSRGWRDRSGDRSGRRSSPRLGASPGRSRDGRRRGRRPCRTFEGPGVGARGVGARGVGARGGC